MTFRHGELGVIAIRPLAALVAGAAAAVALAFMYRGTDSGIEAAGDEHARFAVAPSTRVAERDARAVAPAADPRSEEAVLVAQAELGGASESHRNTTFLAAIRDDGYACAELTSTERIEALLGDREVAGWRVACRGVLEYFVSVGRGGQLVVEPVPVGDNFLVRPLLQSLPEGQPFQDPPPNR